MLLRHLGFERVTLTTPLTRDQCLERLRPLVQSEWAIFGSSPVVGRVGGSSFRIRKRLSFFFHNSFQTYLRGTISSDVAPTRIWCRFGWHRFVASFFALWFLLVWVMAEFGMIAALRHGAVGGAVLFGLVFPVGMTMAGVALVSFGRFLARNERRFLLDFLRDTIDAREAPLRGPEAIERLARS